LKSQSFWEKAAEARQHEYAMQSGRCFRVVIRIVTEAMQAGDLPKGRMPPEQIAFAIAATAMGSHIMARGPHAALLTGMHEPLKVLCQNVDLVLDGLGWKLLSTQCDYDAVDRRIKKAIFPDATWFKD
jgi:hypothetical protein